MPANATDEKPEKTTKTPTGRQPTVKPVTGKHAKPALAETPMASIEINEQGQHIEASVNKDGFTLKLSPQIAEQLGRWIFRLLNLGGLGYLALGGAVPSNQPALDQIAEVRREISSIHTDLDRVIRSMGMSPVASRPAKDEQP